MQAYHGQSCWKKYSNNPFPVAAAEASYAIENFSDNRRIESVGKKRCLWLTELVSLEVREVIDAVWDGCSAIPFFHLTRDIHHL